MPETPRRGTSFSRERSQPAPATTKVQAPQMAKLAGGMKVKLDAVGVDPVQSSEWLSHCMFACVLLSTYWTYVLAVDYLPEDERSPEGGTVYSYLLAAFVPMFLFLIAMEIVIYKAGAAPAISAGAPTSAEAWSSIAAGTIQTATLALYKRLVPFAALYGGLYSNYRLVDLEDNWATLAFAFVLGDLAYYWLHRQAHTYHFLWAGHATHHSSEEYNMFTALRQSWWQGMTGPLWSLPLALIIPPRCYLATTQWVTLYQFWIHTCVIRRLWWPIEFVFSTPSHHRVHHDRRVHKNFAGVFILWDRLFGTFQDELQHASTEGGLWHAGDETCYFGIKEALGSKMEPILQYERWQAVFSKGLFSSNVFKGPGFTSTVIPRPLPINSPSTVKRLRTRIGQSWVSAIWLWFNYAFCFYVLTESLINGSKRSNEELFTTIAFLIATQALAGFILDGKQWKMALAMEIGRNVAMAASGLRAQDGPGLLVRPAELGVYAACLNIFLVLVAQKDLMGVPLPPQ